MVRIIVIHQNIVFVSVDARSINCFSCSPFAFLHAKTPLMDALKHVLAYRLWDENPVLSQKQAISCTQTCKHRVQPWEDSSLPSILDTVDHFLQQWVFCCLLHHLLQCDTCSHCAYYMCFSFWHWSRCLSYWLPFVFVHLEHTFVCI